MSKNFRDQRLRRGWTQQDLADRCTAKGAPVSDVNVGAIERGLWKPRPKLRAVLAELLDLPITYWDERQDVQDVSA